MGCFDGDGILIFSQEPKDSYVFGWSRVLEREPG